MESEIIKSIDQVVQSYDKNYKTLSIDRLLDLQTKLSTLAYNLSDIVADYKRDYNKAYYIRKIEVSKQKNAIINQGKSAAYADSQAIELTANELSDELQFEAITVRLDNKLRQVNKILDGLSQRISFLKQEKDR
jgi:hypothetical protein